MTILFKLIRNNYSPVIGLKSLFSCIFFSVLAACTTLQNTGSQSVTAEGVLIEEFPKISESSSAIVPRETRFRIGDIADVYVFNEDTLSNTYTVDREGNIYLPLVGKKRALGLTTLELQEELTKSYGDNYLQNPHIRVDIQTSMIGNVVVDGSVMQPGLFDLQNPIRLSEAVALAGGLSQTADQKEVYIVREISGKKRVKLVNFQDIRKAGADDPIVYPEDLIYVQDSYSKVAYEEFLRAVPVLSTIAILSTRR